MQLNVSGDTKMLLAAEDNSLQLVLLLSWPLLEATRLRSAVQSIH